MNGSLATSMATSAAVSKIPLSESLHSMQKDTVLTKPKTQQNIMSRSASKHQKKSIKCIGKFVNTYFAQVTTESTCANEPARIVGNIQTVKQALPKQDKAEQQRETTTGIATKSGRCQDEFNRMRERLFRLLSKVPIQVETLAPEPASPLLIQQQQQQVGPPDESCGGLTWQPLMIKYYHDRSLADILELHFNCSLIKYNQGQAQHLYHETIYGPNSQDGSFDLSNNRQSCNNSSNQPVHHHHNQSQPPESYHQVEWQQHQHRQQQGCDWQSRAVSDSSVIRKLTNSQVNSPSGNNSKTFADCNVSQHHHHQHTQLTEADAKVERGIADKLLAKAKRIPALKRQILPMNHHHHHHHRHTNSGSNSSSASTNNSTSSSPPKTTTDTANLSVDAAQIYHHQNNYHSFQKVKYHHHDPPQPLPAAPSTFIACDPFAPVQHAFDPHEYNPTQNQPLHLATDQQQQHQQLQYSQTYQSATNDAMLVSGGECPAATFVCRPGDTQQQQQQQYSYDQLPNYYAPCQSNYQIHDWQLGIGIEQQQQQEQHKQQTQMIEQQPNIIHANGLLLAVSDNYNLSQNNEAASYLAQDQQDSSYIFYHHHQPPDGLMDAPIGMVMADLSLPVGTNHPDHNQSHLNLNHQPLRQHHPSSNAT